MKVRSKATLETYKQNRLWSTFIVSALLVSAIAAYAAYCELFLDVPGVNVPRIAITLGSSNITGTASSVQFNIDIPTVGWLVILSSAGLCIASSIIFLRVLHPDNSGFRIKKRFVYIATLLLIQLLAYCVIIVDLISLAGDFG